MSRESRRAALPGRSISHTVRSSSWVSATNNTSPAATSAHPACRGAREHLATTPAFGLLSVDRGRQQLDQSAVRARNPFGVRRRCRVVQRAAGALSEIIIASIERLYTDLYPLKKIQRGPV